MSVDGEQSIPPGFWHLPQVRDALDRQDANAALALARAGRPASAARTGRQALQAVRVSEAATCLPQAQEIAEILDGRRKPTPSARAFIADAEATRRHLDSLHLAHAGR